jgi:hypothetical protein
MRRGHLLVRAWYAGNHQLNPIRVRAMTRLIKFAHKGKFLVVVREIPKEHGFFSVQPDMDQLRAAFPARWRNAKLSVAYSDLRNDAGDTMPGFYMYTVTVRLKTVTHTIRGFSYDM